ncbi:hypothetical protein SDC9_210145 [bioreactor metagenome]|uniref:Uncharacterized protein n=1 Tax=bioreactor metagenome TaxID=1076179 RepID=A0A645JFB8_9ZZZZ
MKYYSAKILSDILNTISLLLITYSFLDKVNSNIQYHIYSWSFFGLAILLLIQIMWIQITIQRLTKIPMLETNYEDIEKQILTYFPPYIIPPIFFVLTIYTKFF